MRTVIASIVFVTSTLLISFVLDKEVDKKQAPNLEVGVSEMLFSMGEPKPKHYLENITKEMVLRGKELIFNGKTKPPKGYKSKHISKFFKCISCHNTVKEDPDLTVINPEMRLAYAKANSIPYLQGSTFYGIVNRETWYNDDYVLKYGDLVTDAKHSLEGSVQLCAEVCAQGRTLEDWEMESILAYFWSIELKKKDLNWTAYDEKDMKELSDNERIQIIKKKYLQKSPATFSKPPADKTAGYPNITGVPENGQAIYELGCQHCHREKGESDVVLDNSVSTFRWLKKNIASNFDVSIYEVLRKGTYSAEGHKEYMPHYTLEKMSHQQIEDLRAYIELKAK